MNRVETPWQSARFGEFACFRNGLNYPSTAVGDGLKLIGVSDFQNNLTIHYDNLQRVRGFDHLTEESLLKNDDLLFVRSNGNRALIGRVLFIQNLTERVGHSGFTIKARLTTAHLDPLFAALYFSSHIARNQIFRRGSGTNISNLSQDILSEVRIPLPSIEEQKAIVAVLMAWDRGIRQMSALIAAKVRFKQWLMQQLLSGQLRFRKGTRASTTGTNFDTSLNFWLSAIAVEVERGLNGKSYDEGIPKLGECPAGWKTWRLREVLSVVQRPVALRSDAVYRLVTAKRYRAGIVPREALRGDQIKTVTQFEAKAGDFLISRRQIVHGACGLVPKSLDGAIVSGEYSSLRVSDELDAVFLEYLTHTKYLQQTFYQSSVGVTVEKMIFRIDKWLEYHVNLPSIAEQRKIVAVLSAIDREIVLLDRLEKSIAEQKKGLMQKLLTGEVRVKVPKGRG